MEKVTALAPFLKEAFHQTARIAKFFCFLHVTNTYLCTPAGLVGSSMLPTFNQGNLVLAERITTRFGKIEAGDVVMVRSPDDPRKVMVKRVKGVGGDVVTYLVDPKNSDEVKTITVPKGNVWIEGDNVYNTRDSRHFGSIPYGLLHAKIFLRVWPPREFGWIDEKMQ